MGKHKKSKKHKTHKSSSSKESKRKKYEDKASSSEEEWVEAESISKSSSRRSSSSPSDSDQKEKPKTTGEREKRDDWMSMSTSFTSFSNDDRKKQREEESKRQKESEQYNPRACPRELNPYWKDGGDGLPKFQKPQEDDTARFSYRKSASVSARPGWKKTTPPDPKPADKSTEQDKVITEKELNLLAGKLVKAEIMGNQKLVQELKEKLANARKALAEDKEILLIQTDLQGHAKPLAQPNEEGEASGSRKRKKALETHSNNQRVKYFPDDDRHSLKHMFEQEKFTSTNDNDKEFMKIAANIRKNDDLDDLFADNVRRTKPDSKKEEADRGNAIRQHQKLSSRLDSCSKCIQSAAMKKHLIVSMGEYSYLSLPNHEPLLDGHCLISPIRHAPSATQLDENEWNEIREFRRALVKLFDSKGLEAIFFEIALGFHRYPHMVLECVPLPKEEGEMAPIYFKKAIDESETEWAQNKKLVSLKGRDVIKAIPKGLPYFSVHFGMDEGFAHVIEDEKLFPRNFAQEIIGGMLDLHHSKWRKPVVQSFEAQSQRVLMFSDEWKKFDSTTKA